MANGMAGPESSTSVATVGRIDYNQQKEKDRGTNEQSVADFSQSAHFPKNKPPSHLAAGLARAEQAPRLNENALVFAFSFFRVFVTVFNRQPNCESVTMALE
jgi:hypothetical protein